MLTLNILNSRSKSNIRTSKRSECTLGPKSQNGVHTKFETNYFRATFGGPETLIDPTPTLRQGSGVGQSINVSGPPNNVMKLSLDKIENIFNNTSTLCHCFKHCLRIIIILIFCVIILPTHYVLFKLFSC